MGLETAQYKIVQLRTARSLGFRVPRTIVTNPKPVVVGFLGGAPGRVICKAFNSGEINRQTGDVIYTNLIGAREVDCASSRESSVCPGIYQEYVEKAFEVRVTVVRNRCFTARIESQDSERTRVDWRRYEGGIAPHAPYNLSESDAARCVELTRILGLEFSAIDLIMSPDGLTFLELNPNGAMGLGSGDAGAPDSAAIADALLSADKT